jgi:hypothetical protein
MNRNVGPPKFLFDLSKHRLSPAKGKVRKDSAAYVSLSSDPQFQTANASGKTASAAFRKTGGLRNRSLLATARRETTVR